MELLSLPSCDTASDFEFAASFLNDKFDFGPQTTGTTDSVPVRVLHPRHSALEYWTCTPTRAGGFVLQSNRYLSDVNYSVSLAR